MSEERLVDFLSRIFTINWDQSDAQQKYNYQLAMMIDYIIGNYPGKKLNRVLSKNNTPCIQSASFFLYFDSDKIGIESTSASKISYNTCTGLPVSAKNIIKIMDELF